MNSQKYFWKKILAKHLRRNSFLIKLHVVSLQHFSGTEFLHEWFLISNRLQLRQGENELI